jgi:hypothetical protein
MSTIAMASHHLEIFTATQCWRGELTMPSMRRLSDFFNDSMHEFFNLTNATLLSLHQGITMEEGSFPSAALHQNTIIAVVRTVDPSPGHADPLRRVEKQPFPIQVHAPPFVIDGKLHLVSGGQLFETIDAARQNYIALTSGTITMDRMSLVPLPAELVLVNRQWMTAFCAAV